MSPTLQPSLLFILGQSHAAKLTRLSWNLCRAPALTFGVVSTGDHQAGLEQHEVSFQVLSWPCCVCRPLSRRSRLLKRDLKFEPWPEAPLMTNRETEAVSLSWVGMEWLKQEDCCKFEASVDSTVSLRSVSFRERLASKKH